MKCTCTECLKYRETLIQLVLEDHEFNTLWNRLQQLIREFYHMVPLWVYTYIQFKCINEAHRKLLFFYLFIKYAGILVIWWTKSISKPWLMELPNGLAMAYWPILIIYCHWIMLICRMKWHSYWCSACKYLLWHVVAVHHIILILFNFRIIVFRLYCRDPHQLFELMCIQLKSIAIAYAEGLKQLIRPSDDGDAEPTYDPIELLNCEYISHYYYLHKWLLLTPSFCLIFFLVVLDGYDNFCATAKKLSLLLFELQRDTLQNFSLPWVCLNKRMYQRWVYLEVQDLIPECILKVCTYLFICSHSLLLYLG